MNPNQQGSLLMMGSMAAFTFNDTLVKLIGASLPLPQLLAVRGAMACTLLFLLARQLGALRWTLPRRDWLLIAGRCSAELATTYFFLTALMVMPIANITAILQALPLTVTLGAALLFREKVGWRRLSAIAIGFAGVMLIVRPGPEGFNAGTAPALIAVLCITARDLLTRKISSEAPSLVVALTAAVTVFVSGLVLSAGITWAPLDLPLFSLLAGAAVFIFAGFLFSVMAMRVGDVAVISPFRYSGLLWALLLGWLVFGDWPDPVTLLGAAIVVATGIFTLYRERAASGV
jgi:S-adenosylmethionine uptake transporter